MNNYKIKEMNKKTSLFTVKLIFQREVVNGLDLKYDLDIAIMAWNEFMKQIKCDYEFPESLLIQSNK